MNNIIENLAIELLEKSIENNAYKLKEIRGKIEKYLLEISKPQDKVNFLNTYKHLFDDKIKIHREKCKKNDCMFMQSYETAMFFIDQKMYELEEKEEQNRFWRFGTIIESLTISGDKPLVNFGEMTGDIYSNIENMNTKELSKVSTALKELTKAVEDSKELTDTNRKEHLDTLKLLSEEALKPETDRLSKNILKNIIKYSLNTLNTIGSIASISGYNLPIIAEFFLKK